jgi:hypothetical protein
MKLVLSFAMSVALLSGCAATGPETAWGKPGISTENYVTDLGTCMGEAGMTSSGNGSHTAGGLDGKNMEPRAGNHSDIGRYSGGANNAPGAAVIVGGGGVYRDSAPLDVVNRAANQEQAVSMSAQRRATDAFRNCYVQRGYQEFALTPEQRRHLGSLKSGTSEYLAYLAEIGTDPSMPRSPAGQ